MEPTRILAIRHGETAWNVDTRLQGHLDIPLNDVGLRQAQHLAKALVQWDAVLEAAQKRRSAYVEPPKFPKMVRDLALVVPVGTAYGTLVEGLKSAPVKTLEAIELFDVYQGKGLPEGTMSYGVRLTFRDPSKTLQDQQVDGAVKRMLEGAEKHCGAKLR